VLYSRLPTGPALFYYPAEQKVVPLPPPFTVSRLALGKGKAAALGLDTESTKLPSHSFPHGDYRPSPGTENHFGTGNVQIKASCKTNFPTAIPRLGQSRNCTGQWPTSTKSAIVVPVSLPQKKGQLRAVRCLSGSLARHLCTLFQYEIMRLT
jgi:hypothetical protein